MKAWGAAWPSGQECQFSRTNAAKGRGFVLGHSIFFVIMTTMMYLVGDQKGYCESLLSPLCEEKVGTSSKAGAAKREG